MIKREVRTGAFATKVVETRPGVSDKHEHALEIREAGYVVPKNDGKEESRRSIGSWRF
jgi:hypothetical protein